MTKKNKTWYERLLQDLDNSFAQAMGEEYPKLVSGEVEFTDGSSIVITLYRNNDIDVCYYHADDDNDRLCPNIEKFLEDNIPDWETLEENLRDFNMRVDEWQAHGFRDEADYWHYRLG